MSVWKDFCRAVESKATRRHIGDMVQQIDTSAVFEFTSEQIEAAESYEPPTDGIEPFPFPRMCMVGPGGVLALKDPEMLDGSLTYEASFWGHNEGKEIFVCAMCTIQGGNVDVTGARGFIGDEYIDSGAPAKDPEPPPIDSLVDRARAALAKAEATGDASLIRRAREGMSYAAQNEADYREAKLRHYQCMVDVAKIRRELARETLDVVDDWFRLAFAEVRWINKADHYTVEVGSRPPGRKKNKNGPKIRRMHERPRFIVMTKNEIAETWHRHHNGGERSSPMPHLRRGHYKTLRADRYGENKGKRIWVRATHVNGQCVEWRDGDVRYKVI